MNRRRFLTQSSLLTAGLALAPEFVWADKQKQQVGFNLAGLGKGQSTILDRLISLGYKDFEVALDQFKADSALGKTLTSKKAGLSVLSLGPLSSVGMRKNLPILVEDIQKQVKLEYPFIKAAMKDTTTSKDDRNPLIARSSNIASALAQKLPNSTVVYQNRYDGILSKADDLQTFVDNLTAKNTGLAFDVAHFTAAGGNLAEALSKFADRIKILFIQDCKLTPGQPTPEFCAVGEGNVDWVAVDNFIKAHPATKLVVQLEAPNGDQEKAASKAKSFLNFS